MARGGTPQGAIVGANRLVCLADTASAAHRDSLEYLEPVLQAYRAMGILERPTQTSPLLDELTGQVCLVGSPGAVVKQVEAYVAAGVTHLQLRVAPGRMPTEMIERTIRLAGEHVVPRFCGQKEAA